MSQVTRTHGDSLPVFSIDTQNGPMSGALTAAGLVQAQGPALQFLAVDFGESVAAQVGPNGKVEKAIKALAQKSTVHFYQVEAGTQLSIAMYPVGAWTAADAAAAIDAAAGVESTVTDVGFKLATA